MKIKFSTLLFLSFLFFAFSTNIPALAADQPNQPQRLSAEEINCMKAAVEKRENAVQSSLDSFYNSTKLALQTRKNELLSAWTISDNVQRKDAIKAAWKKFKESKKEAVKAFRNAKLSIWKQFSIDRKACNVLPTGEGQGADISF